MPIDPKYKAKFEDKHYYHVYNRSNNKELLFKDDYDFVEFKYKSKIYLDSCLSVVAFCLLGNHFHLLIRIKPIASIEKKLKEDKFLILSKIQSRFLETPNEDTLDTLIIDQFRRFFISHCMRINNKYSRTGSLFSSGFKRIRVDGMEYLKQLILYIHWNPVKHGIEADIEKYEWSSYYELVNGESLLFNKKSLIKIFGGVQYFLEHHNQLSDYKLIADIMLEEEGDEVDPI